jgi:hypothetical protein
MTGDRALQLGRMTKVGADRVEPHRELVASILQRGIDSGEFRTDLEVPFVADLICQLQADYSSRAYRRDPRYPANPELIDAAVRFIHEAVKAG